MYRNSQLEVLQTLGYPVYARAEILSNLSYESSSEARPTATAAEVLAQAERAGKTNPASAKQRSNTVDSDWLKLSIGLVRSNQALVIFDCPDDHAEHLKLIENMLVRCSCRLAESPFNHFRWPVLNNNTVKQGKNEAIKALVAMLKREDSSQQGWVIICGEDANRLLDDETQVNGKVIRLASSTSQMLQQPALRKEAWKVLLPLREDSTSNN